MYCDVNDHGGGYSPNSLGTALALWLDASDNSTITQSSGIISNWNDKRTNGQSASQSNSTARPAVLSNAQNGLSAVRFDGSNDGLISTLVLNPTTYNNISVLSVQRLNSVPSDYRAVWSTDGSDGGFKRSQGYGGTDINVQTGSGYFSPGAGLSTGTFRIVITEYVGTTNMYNSTNGTRVARGSGESLQNTNNAFWIGFGYNGIQSFPGDIAEFMVINRAITTLELQRLEGYLAWKWGLMSSLPVSHPYRYQAP